MKKAILMFALLVAALTASAQIKTDIMGITVGVSTRAQVETMLQARGMELSGEPETDGGISAILSNPTGNQYKYYVNIRFAGVTWKWLKFFFHDGKVRTVTFESDKAGNSYTTIGDSLLKKYNAYTIKNEPGELLLNDDTTTVYLMSDGAGLYMEYNNNALFRDAQNSVQQGADDDL